MTVAFTETPGIRRRFPWRLSRAIRARDRFGRVGAPRESTGGGEVGRDKNAQIC
jgi:hypothetical protein